MGRSFFFQDRRNAVSARRKRKKKFWRKGEVDVVRSCREQRREKGVMSERAISSLLSKWLRSLKSEGSNNSTSLAGLKEVIARMAKEKSITQRSVFVDLGSGAGIPCIYVAKRFGCRVIGVEKDPILVALAREYARQANVEDLCEFVCEGFQELPRDWLEKQQATHIFVYDAVFRAESWNWLFHEMLVLLPETSIGASTVSHCGNWPSSLCKVGESTQSVRLAGSKTSFRFALWRNSQVIH